MPRVVVVLPTATYRASDFMEAARALDIDLIVASDQPPPFDMGDRYLQIDCSNPEAAAEAIAELGESADIDGVVAADDTGVVIAALAGRQLGLHSNPPDAAAASRDKARMRELLRRAEVPQPAFRVVEDVEGAPAAADALGYPVVVKPTRRSASQGVVRADDRDGVATVAGLVSEIVNSEAFIIEEYMNGSEVAVEGLVTDGELNVLAIFDKPDTGDGPYFPETIMITPSRHDPDSLAEVVRVAAQAVRGLGLTHGPVHIELRVENDRARIIEVAARSIGGLCSRSLSFGLMDTSLETLILRNAIGMEKKELKREPQANGVLMIPTPRTGVLSAIEGIDETRRIDGITGIDITVQPGSPVEAPPRGDRYLGFVFARADTPEECEIALRRAMSSIEVLVT